MGVDSIMVTDKHISQLYQGYTKSQLDVAELSKMYLHEEVWLFGARGRLSSVCQGKVQ